MNIYVSNLGYGTLDEELNKLFSGFGQVSSAKVITDKFTGKSKGFGFVEMPDDAEAGNAIKELDGTTVDGRSIKVSEARPREERAPRSNNGGFSKRW